MSECYCDYDGERPSVYQRRLYRARKEHACYECGRKIQPGEQYESTFAIYDGSPETMRTCPHCLALREFVVAHVPCSCWSHGNMIEEVMADAEHWAHEAPGLAFGALRRQAGINHAKGYRWREGGWRKAAVQ